MIRGHAAVVSGDLPLSKTPSVSAHCSRKATIRLVHDDPDDHGREFSIDIEGTDYSFQVGGNVRTVDKRNIASGLVRIGFITPNLDIVISCNPADLKAFIYTVEVINDLIIVSPPECFDFGHYKKFKCICQGPKLPQPQHYHTNDWDCPLSVLEEMLCGFCFYSVLERCNDDEARKILNTWKYKLVITESRISIDSITVTSYTFLKDIRLQGNNLVDIPETIGALPCLSFLDLSNNRLGQGTNWNWLTSPFIRENLCCLYLALNGLSTIPESIGQLKNLDCLNLNQNCLTELPHAMGNLKYLRELHIGYNKLPILPTWLYRKELFDWLCTEGNDFHRAESMCNSKPQLKHNDFMTAAVPSLLETVAKYIITERISYWEYNIPATLEDFLEGAYYCRCGSVVFRGMVGHVVQRLRIKADALREHLIYEDKDVPINIHCCSYQCYKLIEPYII